MARSEYNRSVNEHYGREGMGEVILQGLRAAGVDTDNLTYADLSPVDQLHTRGRKATLELAQLAELDSGMEVLDVGGGLGGPARTLAAEFGCRVTVLDITEEFCRAGEMLTRMTGLGDRVSFKVGDALDMPFPDGSFDAVWTQHSTMNIPDKARLYGEAHRVLRPGGRLAMHEIMEGSVGPIHYPAPWASTPDISFVSLAEAVQTLIPEAGFRELAWQDVSGPALEWFRQGQLARAAGAAPPSGIGLLRGEALAAAFDNQVRNLEEGRIVVIMALFERTAG